MYDIKNLSKLKTLEANAPEAIKAFWAFDKAAMAAGAIPIQRADGACGCFHDAMPLLHRSPRKKGPRGRRFGAGDCRGRCGCSSTPGWRGYHPRHARFHIIFSHCIISRRELLHILKRLKVRVAKAKRSMSLKLHS